MSALSLSVAQAQFTAALPAITGVARFAFRRRRPQDRDEAVAEAQACAWKAWRGLVERGRDPVAVGVSGIAGYAVRHVLNGRRIGNRGGGRGSRDDDIENDLSPSELSALIDDKLKELRAEQLIDERRQEVNKQFLGEEHEQAQLKDTPDMVNFLYGNITLEMFNKIKKLKALSKSSNVEESFLAYRKALELCREYNLDFDRIPCYYEGEK